MIVQLIAKINLSVFVFSNTDKLSTGHSTNDCADNKVCLVMLLCLKSPPNLKLGRQQFRIQARLGFVPLWLYYDISSCASVQFVIHLSLQTMESFLEQRLFSPSHDHNKEYHHIVIPDLVQLSNTSFSPFLRLLQYMTGWDGENMVELQCSD